ncbi:hypothetical protein AB6A23_00430 [Paenibacillus tarimensis]
MGEQTTQKEKLLSTAAQKFRLVNNTLSRIISSGKFLLEPLEGK